MFFEYHQKEHLYMLDLMYQPIFCMLMVKASVPLDFKSTRFDDRQNTEKLVLVPYRLHHLFFLHLFLHYLLLLLLYQVFFRTCIIYTNSSRRIYTQTFCGRNSTISRCTECQTTWHIITSRCATTNALIFAASETAQYLCTTKINPT